MIRPNANIFQSIYPSTSTEGEGEQKKIKNKLHVIVLTFEWTIYAAQVQFFWKD